MRKVPEMIGQTRFLRVRQHRGAHEVPFGGHAGVSGGEFPDFADFNHIQYQIRDPKGFADMLISIMDAGKLPELPFIKA